MSKKRTATLFQCGMIIAAKIVNGDPDTYHGGTDVEEVMAAAGAEWIDPSSVDEADREFLLGYQEEKRAYRRLERKREASRAARQPIVTKQ